jgi:methylmalonyl-CoA mutase
MVAQELPFGTPKSFNTRIREELQRGQNALAIQLDMASRRGVDPSEAETAEVAFCGLSLASLEDIRVALHGITPGQTPIFLWAGASALPMLALVAAHSPEWQGGVLGDPLTEYARDGKLPISLDDALAEMAACVKWSSDHGSRLRTVGVGASLWADAGASAVEELAFALATGVAYLRALTDRGLSGEEVAKQMLFTYTLGSHVFLQIAKFRAARSLWARVLESCGIPPTPAHFHARSSVINKSRLDPHTNLLRATSEGVIGALAGVESMHLAPFDDTVRLPDTFSLRIARNIHTILAEECDFASTSDPAGGSWYVESLTTELASKAWAIFQEIERRGGLLAALEEGYPQSLTAQCAEARMAAVASRRDAQIGVNLFPNPAEAPLEEPLHDAQAIHAERAASIEALRPHTPPKAARSVEAIAAAFSTGATLGQISESLSRSPATQPAIERVKVVRLATGFETLRARSNHYKKLHGHLPKVWLANFGPPKQHKVRADFAAGFLAAGGFTIHQGPGAASPEEAAKAAAKSGAAIVVLCSTDDTYPALVPDFVSSLRSLKPESKILLAGYPTDQITAFRSAGVDEFLHIRSNSLELLAQLQKFLGLPS